MIETISILAAAEDDLDAARQFYEEQASGLGDYFLDQLFVDIGSLLLTGGVHRMVWGFNRHLSNRFPYAVYYKVNDTTVVVYAVLDCRRDPRWLRRRLLGR